MSPTLSSLILAGLGLSLTSSAVPICGNQSFEWQKCPSYLGFGDVAIDCGFVNVPLDWDFPAEDKGQIKIGFARLPTKDKQNRIGNLFYNAGGPATINSFALWEVLLLEDIHTEITDRFDIIGVDLRGSGMSTPLLCDQKAYQAVENTSFYPKDEASVQDLIMRNLAFRESCVNFTGIPLIDYMDQISIAKDHEAVRSAISGEEPLNWLGQSGGSQLAYQYAELFPQNIRAMILDGVVSVSAPETANFLKGAAASDSVLKQFFLWCGKQNATVCPAAHQGQPLEDIWTKWLQRQTDVFAGTIRAAVHNMLYHPDVDFPTLAIDFYDGAFRNNYTVLAGPPASPRANSAYNASSDLCQGSDTDFEDKRLLASSQAPLMDGYSPTLGFEHSCIGWPAPKRNPPHAIDVPANLPNKVLMTNNLYDPATPYSWSINIRDEIGKDRAILVTRQAPGHTTYFQKNGFDGPTVAVANKYLLTLELPEPGTVFTN